MMIHDRRRAEREEHGEVDSPDLRQAWSGRNPVAAAAASAHRCIAVSNAAARRRVHPRLCDASTHAPPWPCETLHALVCLRAPLNTTAYACAPPAPPTYADVRPIPRPGAVSVRTLRGRCGPQVRNTFAERLGGLSQSQASEGGGSRYRRSLPVHVTKTQRSRRCMSLQCLRYAPRMCTRRSAQET